MTLSDFKADFKHKAEKYVVLESCMNSKGRVKKRPHFFSYAMPAELARRVAEDKELRQMMPPFAGIVAVHDCGCGFIIPPKRIHRQLYTDEELRLTDKFYWNYIDYKSKYNGFASERSRYRAEIGFLKAEFKAVTGISWAEHKKDIL